jgi:3-oxoacyl-[acyl-carrier protein] reductase
MGPLQGVRELRRLRLHRDPADQGDGRSGDPVEIEGRTIQAGVPGAMLGALKTMVPLGRAGTPREAAGGVYLFCIPESDYVSGEVLIVGGGVNL